MKKLLALLVVLGMVNVASATIVPGAVQTGATHDLGGVTFNQYIVSLAVPDGGGLASIDGQFTGSAGSILQRTKFTRTSTGNPWVASATGYAALDGDGNPYDDTSIVFPDAEYLLPVGFTEDSSAACTASGTGTKYVYGTGSFFKMVTAFKPVPQGGIDTTSTFDLVSIWIADGQIVNFVGQYSRMQDNGVKSNVAFTVPVPEPATMGLLAIGALGLLRRKHA